MAVTTVIKDQRHKPQTNDLHYNFKSVILCGWTEDAPSKNALVLVSAFRECEEGETIGNTEEILMARNTHKWNTSCFAWWDDLLFVRHAVAPLPVQQLCAGRLWEERRRMFCFLSSLSDDGMDFCLDVSAGGKYLHAV